jgi:Fe-S-cluster containining protein
MAASRARRAASTAPPPREAKGKKTSSSAPREPAAAKKAKRGPKLEYDCGKCLAICCSIYERVEVTPPDLARLAKHLGLSVAEARQKHTKLHGKERILRRRKDHLFGTACKFLHPVTRGCTVYEGRPEICRDYPGEKRCGYYEVLQFERRTQNDKRALPVIQIRFPDSLDPPSR